ncbi:MAG: SGNH/GDSL hydrolase family protein [Bdellovibrionales bacterium]|nr:SGNH/GDSL hydrolase family protein [Bdellovibrionales bacterium]
MLTKIADSLRYVASCLLLTVGLLLVSDYALLLVSDDDHTFLSSTNREARPFTMVGGARNQESRRKYGLNHLGYPGRAPSMPKPPGEYRIIMLGGSTVAMGAPSVPELLEQRFAEGKADYVRVYNFGVPTSTMAMDLARLVFEASEFEPDLALFYGGGNDIGMPFQGDPRPGYPPNFFAFEHNPLLTAGTNNQSLSTLFLTLLLFSRTVRSINAEGLRATIVDLKGLREEVSWPSRAWSEQIARRYLADVQKAVEIGNGFGIRTFVAFQPLLYFKPSLSQEELKLDRHLVGEHALFCRELMLRGLGALEKDVSLQWLDLSGLFDHTPETVFYDGIHPLQAHQGTIASALYHAIKSIPSVSAR